MVWNQDHAARRAREASRPRAYPAQIPPRGPNPDRSGDGDGAKNPQYPTNKVANPAPVAKPATYQTAQTVRPSPPMVADVEELKQRIAANVDIGRKQAGLTQEELGRLSGVRRNEMNAFINGRRPITPNMLV